MAEWRNDRPGIVFIGDSITDSGRTYPTVSEFGEGYAAKCLAAIGARHPDYRLYNRGVAGHCIGDVHARWQGDCLRLRPSLVTLLVGINDVDFSYRRENHPFEEAVLARQLEEMYASVKAAGSLLVVVQPYAFDGALYQDSFQPRLSWLKDTTRALAAKYADVHLIPEMRAEWTQDGLHPTPEGHVRLSEQWIAATRHLPIL